MKLRKVHVIINPASGKEQPILSWIASAFDEAGIRWEVSVTRKDWDAGKIASGLIGKTDAVVVYGGDGSVSQAATVLMGSSTPLLILPGGTANIMARELRIGTDTKAALADLVSGKFKKIKIDTGSVNGKPFFLRVNLGVMADMVLEADRELKDDLGRLAYGMTAVKTLADAEAVSYTLNIDGKKVVESGVSLTITNAGNAGIGETQLYPGISIYDGKLDVLLLRDAGVFSVLKVAGSTLFGLETEALLHWKCKRVLLSATKKQKFILDDHQESAKSLDIRVHPASLLVLAPKL